MNIITPTNLNVYDHRSAGQREIRNLDVFCNNKDEGCSWVGSVSTLPDHLEDCGYETVSCPKCYSSCNKLMRKDLKNHLAQDCNNRPHICSLCGLKGTFYDITTWHTDHCPSRDIKCSNEGCNEKFLRKDKPAHLSVCEYTTVNCQYDCFGCPVKKMRKEIKQHVESDSKDHLRCALKKVEDLKANISKLRHEIIELEDKHANILLSDNFVTFNVKDVMSKRTYKSKPFYLLSRAGHKVCIELEPFAEHLQLKCINVRNSAIFPEIRLKVELLNQTKDVNHILIYLDPEKNYLHSNLISYEKLRDSQYMLNNTIILRVTITPIDKPWLACTNSQFTRISPFIVQVIDSNL